MSGFSDIYNDTAAEVVNDFFGETITYYVGNTGTGKSITSRWSHDGDFIDMSGDAKAVKSTFKVFILNNATTGISAPAAGDKLVRGSESYFVSDILFSSAAGHSLRAVQYDISQRTHAGHFVTRF